MVCDYLACVPHNYLIFTRPLSGSSVIVVSISIPNESLSPKKFSSLCSDPNCTSIHQKYLTGILLQIPFKVKHLSRMSNYSLRARENLRPPGGIMATLENDQTRLMPKAKRKRSGKGNQIQHQIREIRELVTNRGSRTKLSYLKSSLNDSLKEAVFLHEARWNWNLQSPRWFFWYH